MSINDAKNRFYLSQGFTGDIVEQEKEWLRARVLTPELYSPTDLWMEFFRERNIFPNNIGTIDDRMQEWLRLWVLPIGRKPAIGDLQREAYMGTFSPSFVTNFPDLGTGVAKSTDFLEVAAPTFTRAGATATTFGKTIPYLSLPGVTGNYASTPDNDSISVVGDIDIRMKVAMVDWTPATNQQLFNKWMLTGNNNSFMVVLLTSGALLLGWSILGTAGIFKASTLATGFVDGTAGWIRIVHDVDNGAAGNDVKFYTSTDYEPVNETGTWTQLGTTVTTAAVTSRFNSSSPLIVGGHTNGATEPPAGKFYHTELRDGIDGPVVARFVPSEAASGQLSWVSSATGERWLVEGSGATLTEFVGIIKNVPANTPRSWYDPSSFRTNLLVRSEELSNNAFWGWDGGITVTANQAIAPDGTFTMDQMNRDAGVLGGWAQLSQLLFSVSPFGKAYSFSIWVQALSGTQDFTLHISDNDFVTKSSTILTATTTPQRFKFEGQVGWNVAANKIGGGIALPNVGDKVLVWGAQLEEGAVATDYIPTGPTSVSAGGTYLGYLSEGARDNLLLRSEELDNAAWSASNITVAANNLISPDGTLNAERLTSTSDAGALMQQTITIGATGQHSASVWLKQGSSPTQGNEVVLYNVTTATTLWGGNINYSTGIVALTSGTGTATSEQFPDGWWRIKIVSPVGGITAGNQIRLYVGFVGALNTNTFFCYAWGAQIEFGPFTSTYIPTAATFVSRAADVLTYPTAGWYNALEGTLFVEYNTPNSSEIVTMAAWTLGDGGTNEYMAIRPEVGADSFYVVDGGVVQVAILEPIVPGTHKSAAAYKVNDFAASVDGLAPNSDAVGTLPTITTLFIGAASGGGGQPFGTIKRIAYYPTRLPNATFQAMTA